MDWSTVGPRVRAASANWRTAVPAVHITAGYAMVVWGVEAALHALGVPLTLWRILAGVYVLAWAGTSFLKQLFVHGVYVLKDVERAARDGDR